MAARKPFVLDLTLDSDDDDDDAAQRRARRLQRVVTPGSRTTVDLTVDDDFVPALPPPLATPPVVEPPAAAAPPQPTLFSLVTAPLPPVAPAQVTVVTQPMVEVIEAQLVAAATPATTMALDNRTPHVLTEVPSFRAARDDSLQVNDTQAVRRLAAHAAALDEARATLPPAGSSPAVVQPPVESLLLLELGSPLVTNRRTQFEHGDAFHFGDTFAFVGQVDDDDEGFDLGAYQHSFAFTAGRYEIAPPVAALRAAGLYSADTPPRNVTVGALWRQYELRETREIIGAKGSGGLPTMFYEEALGAPSTTLPQDEFRVLYSALERRGGTRFSAEVLAQSMDEVRASTSSRATQPHSRALFAGGVDAELSEGDTDEEDEALESDGEQLPTIGEQDERNLEHIRALLAYESVLLERVGVWRSRVGIEPAADGLYLVDDRVREYRLSAEDECYEYQYDSYVAMDDNEYETLERRIVFVRRGEPVPDARLPRPFYEPLERRETERLGVKSVGAALRARRPDVKNVLVQQADPDSERVNGVESSEGREARPRKSKVAELAEDDMVELVDSDVNGKKRTYDEAAAASTEEVLKDEEEDEEGARDVDVEELGSDQESLASDADIEAMQRARDEDALDDLDVSETIARNAPARLDSRFRSTTIAVPLGWDRSVALAAVRAAYQEGDPLDEDTPWWKIDDAVWTAIFELALYEKLVPCFGPAFPAEARETLGIALELVVRRINAENAFLVANRLNWAQLLRQRVELEGDVLAPLRAAVDEQRTRLAFALEQQEVDAAAEARKALDAATRRLERREALVASRKLASARGADPEFPPLDTQPVLLRVCVPDDSAVFGFLPFVDIDQEPVAHIYALAGQRPSLTAVDPYAAVALQPEAEACAPESRFYPFASQYGTLSSLERQFNGRSEGGGGAESDDLRAIRAVGALRAYIEGSARADVDINALLARFRTVDPRTLGTQFYELFMADLDREQRAAEQQALRARGAPTLEGGAGSLRAARAFVDAVYPTLGVHNRLKSVFLAPPRLTRLAALRRAVQGPLFEEAFGALGRFDAAGLAQVAALKDAERARRAHEQLESRGAERLFANAAQLYASERSSPYGAFVADSAPRVRVSFRLQPADLSLPEGIYREYAGRAIVDAEASLRLLKSRVSVGGARIQLASLEREYLHEALESSAGREPFFLLCAPEVAIEALVLVATNVRVDRQLGGVLREYLSRVTVQPRIATLADYHRFRQSLLELFGKLQAICVVRELPLAQAEHQTRAEFLTAATDALLRREVLVLNSRPTAPEHLVTLPMSGMAALARARDADRAALRGALFEVYYRLAVDLRFKRQGYLMTPFNTSTTLQLPATSAYDNYRTLHTALTRVLRAVDADDDDEVDEMLLDPNAAPEVEQRLRRTGALELRTLRNTLEREIETLHAARTLWFDVAVLGVDPDAFARQVVTELVTLYNAVTNSRVAAVEPLARHDKDTAARPPVPLDPRVVGAVHEPTPLALNTLPGDEAADLAAAGEEFADFTVLVDAVQRAADRGEELTLLLREPEPAATAPVNRQTGRGVNRLDVLMGGGNEPPPPSQKEQPAKKRETGIEALRAQLVRYAQLEPAALAEARRTIEQERVDGEIFRQETAAQAQRRVRGQRRVAGAGNAQLDEPHGSHKRASIAGINKAEQIAAELGRLTARQQSLIDQFTGSQREKLQTLRALQGTIRTITGDQPDKDEQDAAPGAKLRLVGAQFTVLDRALDRVGADLIRARLTQRRAALEALGVVPRAAQGVDIDTQIAVVQRLLAEQPHRTSMAPKRIGKRQLSRFDLLATQLLEVDVARALTHLGAQSLLSALPERSFSVRRGALTQVVKVPGVYAMLLLPAAVERARLELQRTLELSARVQRTPYAVAHRADAHPSLRIDELVRRYALGGELPLAANNSHYTPYAQFTDPSLGGRLEDEDAQIARLTSIGPLTEQHVAFNEGVHRTHASGADTLLAGLISALMHLFGSLHGLARLDAVYERSLASVDETSITSSAINARFRLERHLTMFFEGRMPALEHMRPTDMRLLALVLLGFDTASRIDNDLDNDPVTDPNDSPVTTPAYAHARTHTARRLLADAYYRALLRTTYHGSEGDQSGRGLFIEVTRGAEDREQSTRFNVMAIDENAVRRARDEGKASGAFFRLILTHDMHVERYEDNLAEAKLRAADIDTIGLDRRLLALPSVRAQLASLAPGGEAFGEAARQLVQAALPRPMPAGFITPRLVDQAWLLVPRVTMVGALWRMGGGAVRNDVLDVLEKIVTTLDDSAHLLANDTTDDATALLAEQAEEVEALNEPAEVAAMPGAPVEKKHRKTPKAAVVKRNPVTAAGEFDVWRAGVEEALAHLLRVERARLSGSIGKPNGALLAYEIEATVRPPTSVDAFYMQLAPTLVLARFIVEEGIDVENLERAPAVGYDELLAIFESDEVRTKRRTLSDAQFELAKMLVAAEVARRVLWRPAADGSALLGSTTTRVGEAYRNDENASFTVAVFRALADAYNGNKKRPARQVLGDYVFVRKEAQANTVNGRMVRLATKILETTKQTRFDQIERYVPLYDAIQLLFKSSLDIGDASTIVRNEQFHPLIDMLAAPLTGRFYLRLRTEPYPAASLTSCRTSLVEVYAPRFEWAYSLVSMRRALGAINVAGERTAVPFARGEGVPMPSGVVAVHEFVYATPASPPPPPTESAESTAAPTKKAKRQGHDYVQVNVVEWQVDGGSARPVTLRDVLGDAYSPLTLAAGSDRYHRLLPLTGMPTAPPQTANE